jgi:hypothetical protein
MNSGRKQSAPPNVRSHQARVARDVGGENRGETAGLAHVTSPGNRTTPQRRGAAASLSKAAGPSQQPTKFDAFSLTIPPDVLDIAGAVIDWRSVECLLWVTDGKTPSEYIFSELLQVADIARSASSRFGEPPRIADHAFWV